MCGPVAGHRLTRLPEDGPQGRGCSAFSDSLLFEIVHVEPVIDDAITRHVALDVIFHELLELGRQIAQA